MPEQLSHPTVAELTAFSSGKVDEEALTSIQGHVAHCAACRAILKSLPADNLEVMLRKSIAGFEPLPESEGPSPCDSSPAEVPPALSSHPRYRIVRKIDQGGMGTVFLAEHRLMRRLVALKVMHPRLMARPSAVVRFRREVEAVARLQHPNIAAAHDADQAGDTHFLVMEFVEGMDLARLVREHGPLPVDQACAYGRQAALGLQHAYERGMVHRDIKPHNLMVTPDGKVKILDFGVAALLGEDEPAATFLQAARAAPTTSNSLTDFGEAVGTPDYVAPEQIRDSHTADARSDIYSLGCTLYYLLTGRPPFPGGTGCQKIVGHLEGVPVSLSVVRRDLPASLVRAIERMMAKDPAERYQTPAQVVEALAQVALATDGRTRTGTLPRRRRMLIAAVGVVFALVVAWGFWSLLSDNAAPAEVMLDFGSPLPGTILDANGLGTGFTHRLPGTGGALAANDPHLDLFGKPGCLLLRSTHGCINQYPNPQGSNLGELEAPGLLLTDAAQGDLVVSALFRGVRVPNGSDHLVLYAGTSCTSVVMAGFHEPSAYVVITNQGKSDWQRFNSGIGAFTPGDDVLLTLQRVKGSWTLSWDNLTNAEASGSSPGVSLPWLDRENGLYVGVIASNPGSLVAHQAELAWFAVRYSTNRHAHNRKRGETP